MKVALKLDGLLCETDTLKDEWFRRMGDWKFLNDAVFWAALQPYDDVVPSLKALRDHDIYVFGERPKAVYLTTRAWLRNTCGIELNKDRLIIPSLDRYDCRMHEIDAYFGSDKAQIENLKIETVHTTIPYFVDRANGDSLLDAVGRFGESICRRD